MEIPFYIILDTLLKNNKKKKKVKKKSGESISAWFVLYEEEGYINFFNLFGISFENRMTILTYILLNRMQTPWDVKTLNKINTNSKHTLPKNLIDPLFFSFSLSISFSW